MDLALTVENLSLSEEGWRQQSQLTYGQCKSPPRQVMAYEGQWAESSHNLISYDPLPVLNAALY